MLDNKAVTPSSPSFTAVILATITSLAVKILRLLPGHSRVRDELQSCMYINIVISHRSGAALLAVSNTQRIQASFWWKRAYCKLLVTPIIFFLFMYKSTHGYGRLDKVQCPIRLSARNMERLGLVNFHIHT